jgi:hypothetical protein
VKPTVDRRRRREAKVQESHPFSILGLGRPTAAELRQIDDAKAKVAHSSQRVSKREMRAIVDEVVAEHTSMVLHKIDPKGLAKLQTGLFGFALGIAHSGAYDLLKPYLIMAKAVFMAHDLDDQMAAARRRADDALAMLDPEVRGFIVQNSRLMDNFRARTWNSIPDVVSDSGLEGQLSKASLIVLAHKLERRLFLADPPA